KFGAAAVKHGFQNASFCTSRCLFGIRPLGPKSKMPEFSSTAVVNGDFKVINSKDFQGKWLIFFFYPMDFTFVCPTEIIAFNDRIEEFQKLNAEVVACSCDSQFSHLAWTQTPRSEGGLGDMKIPIIGDFNKKIAEAFGVLCTESGASFRGLFLIDPSGEIRHTLVNDFPVGRSVDEALRTLKAFQFVEKHGEVCPADWEEGGETIKPDVKESKEYFSKVNKS
uniref:thioredoxin-dependent peroxiredoxin n=1 Tax=Syphacia muris TaxID=451379 RepID=A0A0N5ATE2_9BILA